MLNNGATPQGNSNIMGMLGSSDQAKRKRDAYNATNSSDFYGGVGWVIGFLITLFAAVPILWFFATNASASTRGQILAIGIAIAWWFNPLSLGALGYIASNVRVWRFWTAFALALWALVNVLVSVSIASDTARASVLSGLLILFYVLLGLFILYIQLRVFLWAASGKPARFFFGLLGWAAVNGLIYWTIIS